MSKIYFVSYSFSGVHPTHSIHVPGDWFRIQNSIIYEHPVLWEKDKNSKYDKLPGVEALTRIRVIWWKELTDEEIKLLEL